MEEKNKLFVYVYNMTANQLKAFALLLKYVVGRQFNTDTLDNITEVDWNDKDTVAIVVSMADELIVNNICTEACVESIAESIIKSESVENDSIEISNKYLVKNPSYKMYIRSVLNGTDLASVMDTFESKFLSNNVKDYFKNKDATKWVIISAEVDNVGYSSNIDAFINCNKFSNSFIYKTLDTIYKSSSQMELYSENLYNEALRNVTNSVGESLGRDIIMTIYEVYGDIYNADMQSTEEYSEAYLNEINESESNEFSNFGTFMDAFDAIVTDDEFKRTLDDYTISDDDIAIMQRLYGLHLFRRGEETADKLLDTTDEKDETEFDTIVNGYTQMSLNRFYTSNLAFLPNLPKAFSDVDFTNIVEFIHERAPKIAERIEKYYPSEVITPEYVNIWLMTYDNTIIGNYSKLKLLMMYLEYNKYDKKAILDRLIEEIEDILNSDRKVLIHLDNILANTPAEQFMTDDECRHPSVRVLATLIKYGVLTEALSDASKQELSASSESEITHNIMNNWVRGADISTINKELCKEYTKILYRNAINRGGIAELLNLKTHGTVEIVVDEDNTQKELDDILMPYVNAIVDEVLTDDNYRNILRAEATYLEKEIDDTALARFKEVFNVLATLIKFTSYRFGGYCLRRADGDYAGVLGMTIESMMEYKKSNTAYGRAIDKLKVYLDDYNNELYKMLVKYDIQCRIPEGKTAADLVLDIILPRSENASDEIVSNIARMISGFVAFTNEIDLNKITKLLNDIYNYSNYDYEVELTTLGEPIDSLCRVEAMLRNLELIDGFINRYHKKKETNNVQSGTSEQINEVNEQEDETSEQNKETDEDIEGQKVIEIAYLNSEFETVRVKVGPFRDDEEEAYESFKQMLDKCRCTRKPYNDGYWEVVELAHIWDSRNNIDAEIPDNIKEVVNRIAFKFEKNEDGKDMSVRAWTEV